LWTPVVTAAVGSALLVAIFMVLLPPRHSAAAASEGMSAAQLADEQARPELTAAAALTLCPPAPAAPAFQPAAATSQPASPWVVNTNAPVPGEPPLDAPPALERGQDPVVNFIPAPVKTPGCQQCGTAVDFFDSPAIADKNALKDDKLVFVLHVAGNFEEPGFT
jgi:hypothetical protein